MTTAIATRLVEALETAASQEASAALVSINVDVITPEAIARTEARVVRKTRSLLFMSADAFGANGERVATASSVHKLS